MKPDLTLAVDRQHRVLHRPETGQRRHQHDRLEPGRQLPRHDVARTDAEPRESGGGALGLGLVFGEGEGAPVLVDRHGARLASPRLASRATPRGCGLRSWVVPPSIGRRVTSRASRPAMARNSSVVFTCGNGSSGTGTPARCRSAPSRPRASSRAAASGRRWPGRRRCAVRRPSIAAALSRMSRGEAVREDGLDHRGPLRKLRLSHAVNRLEDGVVRALPPCLRRWYASTTG